MMSTKVNWRRNDRSMKTSHRLPEETPSEYANTVFKKKKEICMGLYVKFYNL